MTTYKLKKPFTVGTQTYDELVLTEVKAKHMRTFPANPQMGDMLDLLGALSLQPKSVIDEIHFVDVKELMDELGKQLDLSPQIGKDI